MPSAVLALTVSVVVAGCTASASSSAPRPPGPGTAPATGSSPPFGVPAARQPLTTSKRSPVSRDNEVMALAAQSGHLFAATDQWEYPGPAAYGQILLKRTAGSPWTVVERTRSLRVEALDSFAIPPDQGLGPGHSLLVTQAIVDGRSRIQWLVDGATTFAANDSYVLASNDVDVRSFGAHESDGTWAVYAGAAPTGLLRGTWSKTLRTLVFDPTPELSAAKPGSPGLKTQKVTGFADCGGALYVSINTNLYRRNDGELQPGAARWVPVYREGPVGAFNSGLRGLTCVAHEGSPSLILSTEGNGDVYRFDHLPEGQLGGPAGVGPPGGARLAPILEFSPIPAIETMMAGEGTPVPKSGKGSIGYVIAAYNDFETVEIGGAPRQVFGFERGYEGACPPARICGPRAFGTVAFDAAACFAVRSDDGPTPTYALRCLSGRDFTLTAQPDEPIRSGQAFVSIRTIVPSPFGDGRLYFAGYDCNFYPAAGTAWVASSLSSALDLTD